MQESCGNIYRDARRTAGLTQERWAELLGLSVEAVRLYEGGKNLPSDEVVLRMAEAAGQWPAKIGGYSLGRERAQEKIVEAARKIPELEANIAARNNRLAALHKKMERVNAEQKQLVELRGRVQATLRALETKQVIEDDAGIAAALAAIGDSMGALAPEDDNPSLADLAAPYLTSSG